VNPWWRETHVIESPLPLDECWSRLLDSTARIWGKPVLRNLLPGPASMVLRIAPDAFRGALGTRAAVKLEPANEGTWVTVTLRSDYSQAAFITFWLGFVVLMNLGFVIGSHLSVVPLVLPLAGVGFIALARLFARPDRAALLDFIRMVLSTA